jgi:hypothetical protein
VRSRQQLEVALKENMVFIFKPSVRSADGNSVCTWGDTVASQQTAAEGWARGRNPAVSTAS